MYELMGRVHAALMRERGQGTVEYVGLILLLGVILAGVVTAAGEFKEGDEIAEDRREEAQGRDREGRRRAASDAAAAGVGGSEALPAGPRARLAAWPPRPCLRPRPTRCAGGPSACSTPGSAG